ncbi:hypothetical protein P7K49_021141, partial [Saguinus oedipus]
AHPATANTQHGPPANHLLVSESSLHITICLHQLKATESFDEIQLGIQILHSRGLSSS